MMDVKCNNIIWNVDVRNVKPDIDSQTDGEERRILVQLLSGDLAGRTGNVQFQRLGGDGGRQDLHGLDGNLGDLDGGVHASVCTAVFLILGLSGGIFILRVLWFTAAVRFLTILPSSSQQGLQSFLPGLLLHVEGGLEPAHVLVVLLRVGEGLLLDPLCLTESGVLSLQGLHQVLDARVGRRESSQAQQTEWFSGRRE